MNILFVDMGSDDDTLTFIYKSLSEDMRKSIDKSKLVPKQVPVKGKNGTHMETRYINPDKGNKKTQQNTTNKKEPARTKRRRRRGNSQLQARKLTEDEKSRFAVDLNDRFIGTTTSLGSKIVDVDEKHLIKRFAERDFTFKDIEDALSDPIHTEPGNSDSGSTEYWSREWIVIVSHVSADHDRILPEGECTLRTAFRIESGKRKRRDEYLKQYNEKNQKDDEYEIA